jgi:hypothetical protein
MIYELTIECVFGLYLEEECIRVIEIDEESNLWDLKDIYPLDKGMKLYYWFDFGDNWKFEIKKSRKKIEKKDKVKYPIVVKKIGNNPTQYPDYE